MDHKDFKQTVTCADGKPLDTSTADGKHHESLHLRIAELEKENAELKNKLGIKK